MIRNRLIVGLLVLLGAFFSAACGQQEEGKSGPETDGGSASHEDASASEGGGSASEGGGSASKAH
jgi:hypothetical protein